MARIPQEEIDRIKTSIPLETLCSQRGIELAGHGSKDLKGKCPFHDDHEASFIITPDKNLFHCLGCGKGGDNIQFVMAIEGVSFRHAVEILKINPAASSPPQWSRSNNTRRQSTIPKLASPVSLDADDHELMNQTINYYQETLLRSSKALVYLQKRGLKSHDMIKRLRLGYANRSLGYRLPWKQNKIGDEVRTRLQKFGIYRESGHEHFNGCIIFPIYDNGHVAEIYGRRITKPVRNAPQHLYLPGPHAGVWNTDGVRDAMEWILCESIIDALSFWVHGFENVTASYGVRGFSPDHLKLIRESKPERLIIAYDNDDAGNAAANELAQRMEPEGIPTWRVELPPHADVNDVARVSEDPQAELSSLLAAAIRLLPEKAPGETVAVVSPTTTKKAEATKEEKPAGGVQMKFKGDQAEMTRGERQYRVRGIDKNTSFDHLKVNLKLQVDNPAGIGGARFHLDTFDLYNARQRAAFISTANQVTGVENQVVEEDLSLIIPRIEEHQEKRIFEKMKPLAKAPVMSPEEEAKSLGLLRDLNIFNRILADFEIIGTVGEQINKLVGYLVAVSRKLEDPLSAIVVSRSAAGKSALLDGILAFVPDDDKEVMTAMTAQALFYLPRDGLKHKVLAVMEDEGSERASYPLKILQSEKVLVLAVTVKDQESGLMQTQQKTVDGPVAQLMTSTQAELDHEIANRYVVLTVDEDREQTRRIHEAQREAETLTGLLRNMEREEALKTHHNAQRLLRPLRVINPYAKMLTFPDDRIRLRRDHQKYLGLIRTVAFIRQYQKKIKSCDHRGKTIQYIEVDEQDIRLAHPLAAKVLGRCLDELAPPTRAFLTEMHKMAGRLEKARAAKRSALRFTRRQIREETRWSEAQVRRHLDKLVELEYVLCHRVPGTAARYEYELLYDGQGERGEHFIPGLVDIEVLLQGKKPDLSSSQSEKSSPVRHGIVMGSSPVRHSGESSVTSLAAVS